MAVKLFLTELIISTEFFHNMFRNARDNVDIGNTLIILI
jgi:hypothetical protein